MKNQLLLFLLLLISSVATAQYSIVELNQSLGRGINMGNIFEAPSETAWGNGFEDDYFEKIATLGFQHVRIPIRWDTAERTMQTSPYTINADFLARIKTVVDLALAENLYVIINMHHHEAIFDNPDQVKPRFISQWRQIATHFKDYDNRLLFEVLNEPNSNLTPEKWNVFFEDALSEIRLLNPTRAVLIGVADWGGLGGLSALEKPEDDYLILTIHYYEPFPFTHQGASWVEGSDPWLGTTWNDTNLEREEIINQFQYAINFAATNNLPIHIGEFGAFSTADMDSRVKWTNFLARWFEENNFSWAYWEFSAGFGIYNPDTQTYVEPLINALLHDPMAEPTVVETAIIFESDFTANDNDWVLYEFDQGAGDYTKANGEATIEITQNSTQAWHLQFVKHNVALKQGSNYLVTFEIAASESASFTTYIGKNFGDFAAYSSYKAYSIDPIFQKFSYTFSMLEPDDDMARVAFDFGSSLTTYTLKNFVLQEILPDTTTPTLETTDLTISVFPNPTTDAIQVRGTERFTHYEIYSVNGQLLQNGLLNGSSQQFIGISNLATQQAILVLKTNNQQITRKINIVR